MSLKDMMHSLIGVGHQGITAGQLTAAVSAAKAEQPRQSTSKRVFHGMVEVNQVANGYVINIGRKEGYLYETHIAANIKEVNEIIAAQIVAFRLEEGA